jgi:hypothetical protein
VKKPEEEEFLYLDGPYSLQIVGLKWMNLPIYKHKMLAMKKLLVVMTQRHKFYIFTTQ